MDADHWIVRKLVGAGGPEERMERSVVCASFSEALDSLVGWPESAGAVGADGTWEWHDRRHRVRVEVQRQCER